MDKIRLDIIALSHSVSKNNNYAVVLAEKEGNRKLPIVIGSFEAQAIAVALERMSPNRPLTHDLFKDVMITYDIDLEEIVITDLIDGIFHAELVCKKDGEITRIDSRTSDALALAVRFNCPIYTYDFIMESAGVTLDGELPVEVETTEEAIIDDSDTKKSITSMSISELEENLQAAITEEDYEKAARIRDEINQRRES